MSKTRRMLSAILAIAMVLSTLSVVTVSAAAFADTTGHWAEAAIDTWSDRGVIQGDGDGTFRPDDSITRAEVATVLNNVLSYTTVSSNTFSDVAPSDWFADAVLKLNAAGVLNGNGDGTMTPNSNMTREEATTAIARAFGVTAFDTSITQYSDYAQISDWAAESIGAMTANGYVQGDAEGFRPQDTITRAEIVTIIDNIVKLYITEPGTVDAQYVSGIVVVKSNGDLTINGIIADGIVISESASGTVTVSGSQITGKIVNLSPNVNLVTSGTNVVEDVNATPDDGSSTLIGGWGTSGGGSTGRRTPAPTATPVTTASAAPGASATPDNTVAVVFDYNGGADAEGATSSTQTIEIGGDATAPAAPTRDGYTFLGWSTNRYATAAEDIVLTDIGEDTTFYAIYEAAEGTITIGTEIEEVPVDETLGDITVTVDADKGIAAPGEEVTYNTETSDGSIVSGAQVVIKTPEGEDDITIEDITVDPETGDITFTIPENVPEGSTIEITVTEVTAPPSPAPTEEPAEPTPTTPAGEATPTAPAGEATPTAPAGEPTPTTPAGEATPTAPAGEPTPTTPSEPDTYTLTLDKTGTQADTATFEVVDEVPGQATAEPTDEPTAEPTDEPTAEPTDEPEPTTPASEPQVYTWDFNAEPFVVDGAVNTTMFPEGTHTNNDGDIDRFNVVPTSIVDVNGLTFNVSSTLENQVQRTVRTFDDGYESGWTIKTSGSSSGTDRTFTYTPSADGTLKIWAKSGSGSNPNTVIVSQNGVELGSMDYADSDETNRVLTVEGIVAGTQVVISSDGNSQYCKIEYIEAGAATAELATDYQGYEGGETVYLRAVPTIDAANITSSVEGVTVTAVDGADGYYSFTMPESDLTLTALFGEAIPEPTPTATAPATSEPTPTTPAGEATASPDATATPGTTEAPSDEVHNYTTNVIYTIDKFTTNGLHERSNEETFIIDNAQYTANYTDIYGESFGPLSNFETAYTTYTGISNTVISDFYFPEAGTYNFDMLMRQYGSRGAYLSIDFADDSVTDITNVWTGQYNLDDNRIAYWSIPDPTEEDPDNTSDTNITVVRTPIEVSAATTATITISAPASGDSNRAGSHWFATVVRNANETDAADMAAQVGVSISNGAEPAVGTALNTTITPTGASATYQWYRANKADLSINTILNPPVQDPEATPDSDPTTVEAISGATEASYTPAEADEGLYIYVVVQGQGAAAGFAAAGTAAAVAEGEAPATSVPTAPATSEPTATASASPTPTAGIVIDQETGKVENISASNLKYYVENDETRGVDEEELHSDWEKLFNGDTADTDVTNIPTKQYLVLDLGQPYSIASIKAYFPNSTTAQGTSMIGVDNDTELRTDATNRFSTVLRTTTNNTSQSGVPVIESAMTSTTETNTLEVGPITPTGDYATADGKYQYVIIFNRSHSVAFNEVEIYIDLGQDEPEIETTTATLHDTSGAIEDGDLIDEDTYAVTPSTDTVTGVTTLAVTGSNLREHQNGQNTMGYWAGVKFTLPEEITGATEPQLYVGTSSYADYTAAGEADKADMGTVYELSGALDAGTTNEVSVYTDIETIKTRYVSFIYGGETVDYVIDYSAVTLYQEDQPVTAATVRTLEELQTALANEEIETITVAEDITSDATIAISRTNPVTIKGADAEKTISVTPKATGVSDKDGIVVTKGLVTFENVNITISDKTDGWDGQYVVQAYDNSTVDPGDSTTTTPQTVVYFDGVTLSGGDAGLLVNGALVNVVETSILDVSGNEFGGIEVSKGTGVTRTSALTVNGTVTNNSEAFNNPTIWIDKYQSTEINGFSGDSDSIEGDGVPQYKHTLTNGKDQLLYYNSEINYRFATIAIDKANLFDQSGAIEADQLISDYKATSEAAADGVTIKVEGTNLRAHQNAQGTTGYWAGAKFTLPTELLDETTGVSNVYIGYVDYASYKAMTDEEKETNANNYAIYTLSGETGALDDGTDDQISVYTNIADSRLNADKQRFVTFIYGENDAELSYVIDYSAVTLYQEAQPTTYTATIGTVNGGTVEFVDEGDVQLASVDELVPITEAYTFICDDFIIDGVAQTGNLDNNRVYSGTDRVNTTKGQSTIGGRTVNNSLRFKGAGQGFAFKLGVDATITVYGETHTSRVFIAGTTDGGHDLGVGTANTGTFTFNASSGQTVYITGVDADGVYATGSDLYCAGFTVTPTSGSMADSAEYEVGSTVYLRAVPNTPGDVVTWDIENVTVSPVANNENIYSFTMPANDVTINAEFTTGGGESSPSPSPTATAPATATPAPTATAIPIGSISITGGDAPVIGTTLTASMAAGTTASFAWYRANTGNIEDVTAQESGATQIQSPNQPSYVPTNDDVGSYIYVVATAGIGYTGTAQAVTSAPVSGLSIGDGLSVWADDIVAAGGNHEGSSGSSDSSNAKQLGTLSTVDEKIVKFYPEAVENETSIGAPNAVSGIDNANDNYTGYVEAIVNAADAGNYTVYVIGHTGRNETSRNVAVTVGDGSETVFTRVDTQYNGTDSTALFLYEGVVTLAQGNNTLKIQAPSNAADSGASSGRAPNFIAMYIEKAEDTPSTTALTSVSITNVTAPVVGTDLTTTIAPTGATASYQWYRATANDIQDVTAQDSGAIDIAGATSANYTPTTDDVNNYLYVVATGTGNYSGTVQAVTSAVVTQPVINVASVKLDGNETANEYPTFAEAVTAANTANASAEITLLESAEITSTVDFENGKTITIKAQNEGITLTNKVSTNKPAMRIDQNKSSANVTLDGSSVPFTLAGDSETTYGGAFIEVKSGTFTLSGITIENFATSNRGAFAITNSGSGVVDDVAFKNCTSTHADHASVIFNGNNLTLTGNVTFDGTCQSTNVCVENNSKTTTSDGGNSAAITVALGTAAADDNFIRNNGSNSLDGKFTLTNNGYELVPDASGNLDVAESAGIVRGTISITGISKNNDNKIDEYSLKTSDLKVTLTDGSQNTVEGVITGGNQTDGFTYVASANPATAYTVGISEDITIDGQNLTNDYIVADGSVTTNASGGASSTRDISAVKTYAMTVPVKITNKMYTALTGSFIDTLYVTFEQKRIDNAGDNMDIVSTIEVNVSDFESVEEKTYYVDSVRAVNTAGDPGVNVYNRCILGTDNIYSWSDPTEVVAGFKEARTNEDGIGAAESGQPYFRMQDVTLAATASN